MEANYFTILYWFCHTSTWIRRGCTCVPHPEPPSHLPPDLMSLKHKTTSLFFFFFFRKNLWPQHHDMLNLSCPTSDWTHTPCNGRRSLHHCTTGGVPSLHLLIQRTLVSLETILQLFQESTGESSTFKWKPVELIKRWLDKGNLSCYHSSWWWFQDGRVREKSSET